MDIVEYEQWNLSNQVSVCTVQSKFNPIPTGCVVRKGF
jgi:hypothetical protein